MNYTKLEEILHKEAGNIYVRCYSEEEYIRHDASKILYKLDPCDKKLKALFDKNLDHLNTFDDLLRFFKENKPSAIKIFFSRIFGWLSNDYTYLEKMRLIEEYRSKYNEYVQTHTADAAFLSEELNKDKWDRARINVEGKKLEALCRLENGSLCNLCFGIFKPLYTQNSTITICFSCNVPSARDSYLYIELPEKYFKELEWDE